MQLTFDISNPLCLANIRACAQASKLVYDSPNVTGFNGETALVQDCGNAIVVAFPGTHDLEDVKEDLDCPITLATVNGKPCGVHSGFNKAFVAISPPVCKAVLDIIFNNPKPLFLTGHSKGAAVARRVALEFNCNAAFKFPAVITFGEPRGGQAAYANICNAVLGERSLRITNAADPVPWVPAWVWPWSNRQSGREGWMPPDQNKIAFGASLYSQLLLNGGEILRGWKAFAELFAERPAIWESLKSWEALRNDNPLSPLLDHHIDNYIRRLNEIV